MFPPPPQEAFVKSGFSKKRTMSKTAWDQRIKLRTSGKTDASWRFFPPVASIAGRLKHSSISYRFAFYHRRLNFAFDLPFPSQALAPCRLWPLRFTYTYIISLHQLCYVYYHPPNGIFSKSQRAGGEWGFNSPLPH